MAAPARSTITQPPRIRPALANTCGELATLAITAKSGNIDNKRRDTIGSRGAQLIVDISTTQALSLGDLLLKLTTWTQLPRDFWDNDLIIEAAIADLRAMIAAEGKRHDSNHYPIPPTRAAG